MSDLRAQKIANKENPVKRRNFSNVIMNELKSNLSDIDWSEVNNENDPNTSLDVFYRILNKQELRAHMALVTRRKELRARRSYGMSSNKIL